MRDEHLVDGCSFADMRRTFHQFFLGKIHRHALTDAECGVVGGRGVSSVVVSGCSGCGGGGGAASTPAAEHPRCAETEQRQHDPGRQRQAHGRPTDRSALSAAVILYTSLSVY